MRNKIDKDAMKDSPSFCMCLVTWQSGWCFSSLLQESYNMAAIVKWNVSVNNRTLTGPSLCFGLCQVLCSALNTYSFFKEGI